MKGILTTWISIMCLLAHQQVNAQYIAVDDSFVVIEGFCPSILDVLANDIVQPANSATVTFVFGNALGSVAASPLFNSIVYCSDSNNTGSDVFQYVACDTFGQICDTGTVFLTIVTAATDSVWPGDANNDGVVNSWDILPIGLLYGEMGQPRPIISTDWQPNLALDWGDTALIGIDHKFADCNGDGTIEVGDLQAIQDNLGLTHPKNSVSCANPSLPPLKFEIQPDTVYKGESLVIDLNLGGGGMVLQDVYGLAFNLRLRTDSVDLFIPELTLNLDNSFVNDSLSISLAKSNEFSSEVEIGFTRIDRQGQTGFGDVGSIIIVIDDNIDGLANHNTLPIYVLPGNVKVIDNAGKDIPVCAVGDSVIADALLANGWKDPRRNIGFTIAPNPAENICAIQSLGERYNRVAVYNLLGVPVIEESIEQSKSHALNVAAIPSGTYIIQVEGDNYSYSKKFVKH